MENQVYKLDSSGKFKYQRSVIYISEFTYLTISQLQVSHWIQTSDSFLIIRCDSCVSNFIQISELKIEDYSSYNILNYINPAIFIQIDAEVNINITNCNFKRCNFWSPSPNNEMMEAALMRIKSPKSKVIFDELTFKIANVYNSSNSIVVVDATTIFMFNTQVDDINTQNAIGQLYSTCGFVILMAEQIRIINTIMSNINSAQYGFFYNQLKQQGKIYVQNCIFNNTKLANTNLYITQLGGIFTIDGRLSMLQLSFINITAVNIYAEKKAAFLYLIPSSISNQVYMKNLSFKNLISADNLFCRLKFPSNSQNNKIVIDQISINNNENSTLLQQLIGNLRKGQIVSNYEGLISTSFSSVLINEFTYEGYLTQPIFILNVIYSLKISNLKFVSLSILNQLEQLIDIDIQNADLVFMQNFQFEKMNLLYQIEYFLKLNCTSVKNPIISNSIYFINNFCSQCQNGYMAIFNNQNQSKVIMTDCIFYNNNCGVYGCLIFENLQLKIQNSVFIKNQGQNNGILQGTQSVLLIQNSILKNNQIMNKAGAIFLNRSIIDAQNLLIVNNSANIGGAIYCENSQINKQTRGKILFKENYGLFGFNNIREYADFLKLNMFGFTINNTREIQKDEIFDTPTYIVNHNKMRINKTFIEVASGQKLNEFQVFDKISMQYSNYTISLQIEQYTQLGEKIIQDYGDKCLITQYQINSELNQTNYEIISSSAKENMTQLQFDPIWESYKLDNFTFYLDPYSNQSIYLMVLIKCEQMSQNYNFIFKIKTLPCGIGEYYSNKQCLKCDYDKGYFSVTKNSQECQRLDPTKMKSVTSYQIELLSGFWRLSYYSNYIEQCENPSSCLGGWNVNYESCSVGQIGAICNECDIYNIRGQSSYIKSLSGVCQKNEKQKEIYLITFVLMLFTFIVTYVISFLKSEMHIMYKRMKYMTIHHRILFQCEIDQLNTSLKLLINFMQILYPILPHLKFNEDFADLAWPIGKSSKTLLFLINFVADSFEIEIPYLKMVWAMLIPIFQMKDQQQLSYITNVYLIIIYLFGFLFDSKYNGRVLRFIHIYRLTIVLQRRNIANIDWIGANLAYQYQTEEHQNWIWQFIVPSMILIFLVIPILFFTFIYKKSKQTTNVDISYGIYGYLCSDYKQHLYFWELVTLEMKLTLIFILFFLDNDKTILKNLISILILLGYYASINSLKPFSKSNLNKLEKSGIILCCVFISLNILTLASQKYSYIEVQYLTQILMLLILLFILLYTLFKILIAFVKKYQDLIDIIRIAINLRFPNLTHYCPFFKKHLKVRCETRKNIINKFKRIKSQLKLMKQNNIRIIRNPIIIHDELVSNIIRSDQRQLIQQYSIQNSFMF
ncbi:unnamed protein product [Paramecium octaurelia]|uniref:Transmembrane protein n=1 Tax=Paramecium octaurelia TaxID=43137 RepID=A0A8S1UB90_PAROT|nr:unnamed protein product [Paramecium octaurelia]